MTEPFEQLDEIIIHIAAWRRLRHGIEETRKSDPEKFGEVADMMLLMMDTAYSLAANDLKKKKESMERNLEKIRENSRYGRMKE